MGSGLWEAYTRLPRETRLRLGVAGVLFSILGIVASPGLPPSALLHENCFAVVSLLRHVFGPKPRHHKHASLLPTSRRVLQRPRATASDQGILADEGWKSECVLSTHTRRESAKAGEN